MILLTLVSSLVITNGYILLLIDAGLSIAESSAFRITTSCVCLGNYVTFECSVTGDGGTVWQGTALNACSGGKIIIRHSQFENGYHHTQMCGFAGLVTGHTISSINNNYISQLTVNVNLYLNSSTIECTTDSGREIGSRQLLLTLNPLPPPNNITLSRVNNRQLTFSWNSNFQSCPAVFYSINANCCACPATTSTTHIVCNITANIRPQQMCVLTIQTVVCGNIHGTPSQPVEFFIRVPGAPNLNVIPEYSSETMYLNRLFVEIPDTGEVHTSESDPIDAAIVFYTVTYIGQLFNNSNCGSRSATIPAISCEDNICKHMFEVSSLACHFNDIRINSVATNAFGDGPNSEDVQISAINRIIDIDINFTHTFKFTMKCIFSHGRASVGKSCGIDYGPKNTTKCDINNLSLHSEGNLTTSNTVYINLYPTNFFEIVHCYRLTANDGITTVALTGIITVCDPYQLSTSASIQSDVKCGDSYTALEIENGFVCYNGMKVGSTAIHYCFDCGYSSIRRSTKTLIRTCEQNGQWNGTFVKCDCKKWPFEAHHFWIFGGGMALLITIIAIIFLAAIYTLYRAKAKIKKKLKQTSESIIYEEIDANRVTSLAKMDTADNVAYALDSHEI